VANVISRARNSIENLGKTTTGGIAELGYVLMLLLESLYWVFVGFTRKQPVRIASVFKEVREIGINAIPIVSVLCMAVGTMLAIQGISTLKTFGQELRVIDLVATAVTREFSPLIVGILVAGRSGSAITARIGTMHESQEIDALRVIGINPVRHLGSPVLVGMMISVPMLTVIGDFMCVLGSGIFSTVELDIHLASYFERTLDVLTNDDVRQGLIKSSVFAIIIALVGVSNGFQVGSGAEGVGRSTTRSVVLAISFIVIADMIFTYFLNIESLG
jgi:phospholipid/cholesterol/gamma-HCH transport system permease protein